MDAPCTLAVSPGDVGKALRSPDVVDHDSSGGDEATGARAPTDHSSVRRRTTGLVKRGGSR